jgi:FkbM family methyltransferase
MLDIGANIGLNSLRSDQINKITGVCHLFEPQSDVFLLLNLNTQSLNRKLYNMAISDNYNIISYIQDTINIGATTIQNTNSQNDKILVLSCNLDSLKFDNKISLIKIDVEKNEIKVLNGALSTLKQHMPNIIIEAFPENYSSVEKILLDLGYIMKEQFALSNYLFIPKV